MYKKNLFANNEAYKKGYFGYLYGWSLNENPYKNSQLKEKWANGYRQAKKDSKP